MSGARTLALVLGTLLVLSGLAGFVAVGQFWLDSVCPHDAHLSCPHPSNLTTENETVILVGTVGTTGVVVTGALITFAASYFPDPGAANSRRVAATPSDGPIRQPEPSSPQAADPPSPER
jgi:hypothetical protein